MPLPKKKPIILAVASDLHAGSTLGLCPYTVQRSDGGSYKSSRAQRWLWRCWKDYIGQVQATAAKYKVGYTAILNGDVIEGNHHKTLSVVSGNETTQMRITEAVLSPLLEDAEKVYFVGGTPAHVGQSARLENKIADNWEHVVKDENGSPVRWHLLLDANGTLFDIAHHGKIGRLPWTRANGAHSLATQTIVQAVQTGQKIPNVILRAHFHQYVDTYNNVSPTRLIAMPAWQLVTGYVQRFAPGVLSDIGGLIFTCWPGGAYDLDVVRFRPKPVTPERMRT